MSASYKVALISLGCAKNLVDSEVMLGYLREAGHQLVLEPEDADVVVVNTCGFIDSAKEESINELLESAALKESHGVRWVIAAGCLSQRYSDDLLGSMPEVDAFLGSSAYPRIAEVIARLEAGETAFALSGAPEEYLQNGLMPRVQATLPATAYLKVADGCDNRCSYCAIPLIRGGYRSRTIEDILLEAERMLRRGVREICLIAQDTTRYGLDLYGSLKLAELCRRLLALPELHWLRILYCHPAHLTTELLQLMRDEPKLCAYLDIPLQHSEDRLLRSMNRPVSKVQTIELLREARSLVPDLMLRTSIIVGFPGETEDDFAALSNFVQEMRFDHLGAFTYSQEEDTPAAALTEQLDEEIKESRRDRLMILQQGIAAAQLRRWLGKDIEVLVERVYPDGLRVGRFAGQAPDVDGLVLLSGADEAVGTFVKARVTGIDGYDLRAERRLY